MSLGTGEKHIFLDIHDLASNLGPIACRNLPAMHALTGCDTMSSFYGVGKKIPFEILLSVPNLLDGFGLTFDLVETDIQKAETFIASCYKKKYGEGNSINEFHYKEFLKCRKRTYTYHPAIVHSPYIVSEQTTRQHCGIMPSRDILMSPLQQSMDGIMK